MNFKEWLIADENAYGFFEVASYLAREQEAIAYAIMIANFYKDFGIFPRVRSSDTPLKGEKYNLNGEQTSELQLGNKLSNFRVSKKANLLGKKINAKYYKSAEEAGINAGLPQKWMDSKDIDANTLEQTAIKYAVMIANFYKDFGAFPKARGSATPLKGEKYNLNGEQVTQQELGGKLIRFRRSKKANLQGKKINAKYYKSAEDAGIKAGLPQKWMDPDEFYVNALEQQAINYAEMIANFYKDFNRMPSIIGTQKLKGEKYKFNDRLVSERELAIKVNNFREARKAYLQGKKIHKQHYTSAENAGIKAGLPENWMHSKDSNAIEQEAIKFAKLIAYFYKDFKRMPSTYGSQNLAGEKYNLNGIPVSEKQLATKLYNFKDAKKGHLTGNTSKVSTYKPSVEEAGIKAGLPIDWMDVGNSTPKKYVNHHNLLHILKNMKLAKKLNFQTEMVCHREGKRCLKYDGAYRDDKGNPLAVFEYQGEQHYYPSYLWGLRTFLTIVNNDEEKLNITKENNIPFLRIPFWKNNQMETLVYEFMQNVLNAPNNKLSQSQWNHYAVDIATPDAKQQQTIDKGFCKYFNSPKGKEDAALVALYPEIKKKWKMCNSKTNKPKIPQK